MGKGFKKVQLEYSKGVAFKQKTTMRGVTLYDIF